MKTSISKVTDVKCVDGKRHKWDKTIKHWAWCKKCGSITKFHYRAHHDKPWTRVKEKSMHGNYLIGIPEHLL